MASFNIQHYATTRENAVEDADKMQASVLSECTASGRTPPPYHFSELIGKGSFGRVYKARHVQSDQDVSIKVINIETGDTDPRSDTFADILKEIETLKLLSNTGARNINIVLDAFLVGHSMWMITEYCAGGSVSTLMRPTGGLPEKWIIPILREVAEAVSWTHQQGVIHRDIKCANVLVTEAGGVQLCDFGVAAVNDGKFDKRSTFTGSLHWMAPELFNPTVQYGTEVDIWAFGSMAYEIASGEPPNADFRDINRFGAYLKQHHPQLHGDEHSSCLKDLIAFCLVENPSERPAIGTVQHHPYIYNTDGHYPTVSLSKLVDAYRIWEAHGGSRLSLFSPGGAQREADPQLQTDDSSEWTFSTIIDLDQALESDVQQSVTEPYEETTVGPSARQTRRRGARMDPRMKASFTPLEKLFDPNTISTYNDNTRLFYGSYGYPPAMDLPLRDHSKETQIRESLIDLDAALDHESGSSSDVHASETATTPSDCYFPSRVRRRTLEWKFPVSSTQSFEFDSQLGESTADASTSCPRKTLVTAYPHSDNRASATSLIDLDASLPDIIYMYSPDRPSTGTSDSASSQHASFDLEYDALGSATQSRNVTEAAFPCEDDSTMYEASHPLHDQRVARNIGDGKFNPNDVPTMDTLFQNYLLVARARLPPAPTAPSIDILEGSAPLEGVKEDLSRLIYSLKDHLISAGQVLKDAREAS